MCFQNYLFQEYYFTNKDKNRNERFWIYEIHFIDSESEAGGIYEQLLS
ncbi:MAG: hypothetical protein IPI04_12780 [Ignavibacteria bacterium]|nr:hypothetical protein [Ignavibacteria bacterium]